MVTVKSELKFLPGENPFILRVILMKTCEYRPNLSQGQNIL